MKRFASIQEKYGRAENISKSWNQQVDEGGPKIFGDCRRVFQMKDENVFRQKHCVGEKHNLEKNWALDDCQETAVEDWQRSETVSGGVADLTNQHPLHRSDADWRNQFVHQSSTIVGAEPLVPDDAPRHDDVGDAEEDRNGDEDELRRPILVEAGKAFLACVRIS